MTEKSRYCSDIARDHQLSLAGTATQGKVWFLLEYPAAWDSKAFDACNIPEEVKAHLAGGGGGTHPPDPPVGESQQGWLHFFIGSPRPRHRGCMNIRSGRMPTCWRSTLASWQKITPRSGSSAGGAALPGLHNGKRDLCCAKFGMEVFKAMKDNSPDDVWQSSHIGGHNKAPVTLFFPHGLNYGMTSPDDIRTLDRIPAGAGRA